MNEDTRAVVDAALARLENPYPTVKLPEWFERFRPHQIDAIERVVRAYGDGVKCVVLDAPTGSGKTLIAESVRQLLRGSAVYVCNNKALQTQFAEDYPYASVMKGRGNYESWTDGVKCDDCNYVESRGCSWCPEKYQCPYEVEKNLAIRNRLAVVNTAYLLTEGNGPGRFKGRELVVLDEADTLENTVMGYVGFELSRRRVEQFELGEPSKVTMEDAWVDWVADSIPKVVKAWPVLNAENMHDVRVVREWNFITRLTAELASLRKALVSGGWVCTGKNGAVAFKPVVVDDVSPQVLWPLGKRLLLMSASMVSAEFELAAHGWKEPYEVVSLGSTFDVENRRVKVVSCADMSRKVYEIDGLCEGIDRVLARHPDERVLVHTVSHELAKKVSDHISGSCRRPVITYTQAVDRERALQKFRRTSGGVLVASSMDRGVDLADDLCRVVVVAKVPYPNLGDRQIWRRIHVPGGRAWYNVQTVRSLVQMTGRATRHSDDWSVSYILDSQFERGLWGKARGLFPSWRTDALDWRDRLAV